MTDMILVACPFGPDPCIILRAAIVNRVTAIDAGSNFKTGETAYTLFVPATHEAAVRALVANPPTTAPDPIPEKVTETQFMRAAVKVGIVTDAEAKAYLARGVIPAFVETAVAQIPANVRTDAELKIIGSDTFHRADPVFAMLIAGGAATSEQVDDLFRLAATLD
jgi:hypothetical protein